MLSQLCAEQAGFFETYGLLIIMIAFIAILLVFSSTKRKKDARLAEEFVNNLKVGDKIKTYSGIYGTIVSLKETPNGKIAVIETGEKDTKTTMTIDLFAIYCVVVPTQNVNAKGIERMDPVNITEQPTTIAEQLEANEEIAEIKDMAETKEEASVASEQSTLEELKEQEKKTTKKRSATKK